MTKSDHLLALGKAMNTVGGTEAKYAGEPQGCWLHGVITCYSGVIGAGWGNNLEMLVDWKCGRYGA